MGYIAGVEIGVENLYPSKNPYLTPVAWGMGLGYMLA